MAEMPLPVQIKAVEREIAMRKAVYPGRVAKKAMKPETAAHEILAMEAVLRTLKRLEWRKHWSQACSDDCGHSDAEHAAFVLGVAAGELGFDEEACPYGEGDLREDWLAGYSVGSINGENSNESTANNGA
ncbi:MAG TPA: Rmf/CrpP family protein [Blastocatellia bacterium]|nr:Rmf/CrpP family protein [Blastocatellia bacterium]